MMSGSCAHGGPQGRLEGMGVVVHLALGDLGFFHVMHELDGVLDGEDVGLARVVDLVDHGGQGGAFAAAGGAGDQDEALLQHHFLQHGRHAQLVQRHIFVGMVRNTAAMPCWEK